MNNLKKSIHEMKSLKNIKVLSSHSKKMMKGGTAIDDGLRREIQVIRGQC